MCKEIKLEYYQIPVKLNFKWSKIIKRDYYQIFFKHIANNKNKNSQLSEYLFNYFIQRHFLDNINLKHQKQ